MGLSDMTKDALKKAPGKIIDIVKNIDPKEVIDSIERTYAQALKKQSDSEIIALSKKNPENKYVKEEMRRRKL